MSNKQYAWFWICYAMDNQGPNIRNTTIRFGTAMASSENNLEALAEIKDKLYSNMDIQKFAEDHHRDVATLPIAIRRINDIDVQPIGDFSIRIPKGDIPCDCTISLDTGSEHHQSRQHTVCIERIYRNIPRYISQEE